ncbi:hypothetical protein GCM10023191_053340 [Actinoallomurus oryzae]|uniref:Uncharacterized protein n=1 Tax=Actinoallomurus oryzae TaxID=502180 RepID=A0ABP8QEK3_9ACTN
MQPGSLRSAVPVPHVVQQQRGGTYGLVDDPRVPCVPGHLRGQHAKEPAHRGRIGLRPVESVEELLDPRVALPDLSEFAVPYVGPRALEDPGSVGGTLLAVSPS